MLLADAECQCINIVTPRHIQQPTIAPNAIYMP